MHYGAIKKCDIANGEGIRVSLFVSGCRNRCKGCFQPETWDFNYGNEFTAESAKEIFSALDNSSVRGLTILGGEPMEPENQRDLLPFLLEVKCRFPEKTVWLYTGSTYEEIAVDHEGDSIIIAFNNKFLIDSIRACDAERIKISMSTALTSINIEPADSEEKNEIFMILPVRMKD